MRQNKLTTLVDWSVERTLSMLFRPFIFKKWLKLYFIAFCAGSATLGLNFNLPFDVIPKSFAPIPQLPALSIPVELVVFVSVTIIFSIIIFFIWLASQFSLLYIQTVIDPTTPIKATFTKNKHIGNTYFAFNWRIFLWILITIALSTVFFFVLMPYLKQWMALSISAFLVWFLTIIIGFIALCILFFWIKKFVLPIMVLDQCTFDEAWKKASAIYKANANDIWIFLWFNVLVIIVLAILSGIILVSLIICMLIPAAIILIPAYLIFVVFLKLAFMKIIFVILCILVALPLIIICMMGSLPLIIVKDNLSLYYLSSLNVGYTPLPLQHPNGGNK